MKFIERIINNQNYTFKVHNYSDVTNELISLLKPLTDRCFSAGNLYYPPTSFIYGIFHLDQPVSMCVFTLKYMDIVPKEIWKPTSVYLYNVCTDQEFRGYHLQESLLKFAFLDLKSQLTISTLNIYLIVNTKNSSAIKLYARLGFIKLKLISSGTPDGQPAYLCYLNV